MKAKAGLIGLMSKEMRQDFWGTMEKLSRIGYKGIEVGTEFFRQDVEEKKKKLNDLGMNILTIGTFREKLEETTETLIAHAKSMNVPRVTVWIGPCDSKDQLLKDAEMYNKVGRRMIEEGIKFCYHNHEHEFRTSFNGVSAMEILTEYTDPEAVFFEMDIAWISVGGRDPVEVLKRMKGRVPAIHVKDVLGLDYPTREDVEFTSVGTGVVKVKEAVKAAIDTGIEWVVVEQDRLRNLDHLETITLSYLYLKEAGLVE